MTSTRRPTGRPSEIDRVVAQVPIRDGDDIIGTRDVTAADRIVELIRAGSYVETAAAACGLSKMSLYRWMKDGANASKKVIATANLPARERFKPSRYEERAIVFCDAIAEAAALGEVDDVTRLARAAQGGHVIEQTVENFDNDGNLIGRTVTRKTLPPDPSATKWRLERRHSGRWGQRGSLELTGAEGLPLILDTDALLAKLRAARAAHADDDGPVDGDEGDDGGARVPAVV